MGRGSTFQACQLRLQISITKLGTVQTTVSIPHTCPPETHEVLDLQEAVCQLRLVKDSEIEGERSRPTPPEDLGGTDSVVCAVPNSVAYGTTKHHLRALVRQCIARGCRALRQCY
jgi:hypothetical protein